MRVEQTAKRVYSYKSAELRLFTPANILTLLRVAMVPVIIWVMLDKPPNAPIIAASCFAFASLASIFDGYIARRRSEVTLVGQLLDAFMNKALVVAAMILLLNSNVLPPLVVILTAARDVYVMVMRSMAHERSAQLPNVMMTPIKTILLYVGVFILILSQKFGADWRMAGLWITSAGVALAWASALIFTKSFFQLLQRREQL